MTQLCHFSANCGESLTKKTILRQEKPRKHSGSKMQNCLGRNSLSNCREEKLFWTNKLKKKAPIGGSC